MTDDNLALILTESPSARNSKMASISQEAALDRLNKAKALIMAYWQGGNVATTEQIAEYFEVSEDTVRTSVKNNRDELESDGLRKIGSKDSKALLSMVRSAKDRTSTVSAMLIWTPRSALRLAMLLRDSDVAKQVRTLLLDAVEVIPQQNEKIRELELMVRLREAEAIAATANKQLMDTRSTVLQMYGADTPATALILGATIVQIDNVVEKVIDIASNRSFDGIGIQEISKRLGFAKNTKACWAWLESIGYGKDSESWELQLSAVEHHKLQRNAFSQILTLWNRGERQRLIGEVG